MTEPAAPQDIQATRRQMAALYPQPVVNGLSVEQILQLPSDAMVVILGGPNCDITGANLMKRIPNTTEAMSRLATMMPQLVDPQTRTWSSRLDCSGQGSVERVEVLAGFIRGAQIAFQRGIPLDQVPMADIQTAELSQIIGRLENHGAAVCTVTPSPTPPRQNLQSTPTR